MKVKVGKQNSTSGITLIALVITIIVLLILAGVAILTLTGENGILNQAEKAKDETENATVKEIIQTELMSIYISNGKYEINEVKDKFKEDLGIETVDNQDGTFGGDYKGVHFEVYKNQSIRIGNKLKVGDNFEYDVSYTDISTNVQYNKDNGWKILNISPEDGSVKIISTGIPAKMYINYVEENNSWWGTEEDVYNEYNLQNLIGKQGYRMAYGLKYKFGEIDFSIENEGVYNKAYFKEINGNKTKTSNGNIFLVNNAKEVRNLTLEEINQVRGKAATSLDSISGESNETFKSLFLKNYNYWLATPCSDPSGPWWIHEGGIFYHYTSYGDFGLIPVITIEND